MIDFRRFASTLSPFLLAGAFLVGCGGPLSYTVEDFDRSSLDDKKKGEVAAAEEAVNERRAAADVAEQAVTKAEAARDGAAAAVEKKEAELEVAEAALHLEETKEGANHAHDVGKAEKKLATAKSALEVARKAHDLSERRVAAAEAAQEEAKRAWIVALAQAELVKLRAQGGKGPAFDQQEADFEQQLAEAEADLAEAKRDRAEADADVDEAKAELTAARG